MTGLTRRAVIPAALALGFAGAGPAAAQAPAGPFVLDPLPYPAERNAPHIGLETMQLHHDRHHAAYVTALNAAASRGGDWAKRPLPEILASLDTVPDDLRTTVRDDGGGHANHTMFWQVMGGKGGQPSGEVGAAITRDFGSFDRLRASFNEAGTRQFGSGWVFVTVARDGKLALTTRPNQDTPLMEGGRVLFGNDVWEHAYYVDYRNRRADYLTAWWNVVDWDAVARRYAEAKAGRLGV